MNEAKNPYADIISLPHHQSEAHPQMSMQNRAAQFSPYAALVGFDGVIAETGRLTDRKKELSEEEKDLIDQKLMRIHDLIRTGILPAVTVTFFVKDPLKEGGAYETFSGNVRKIDRVERMVVFAAESGRSGGKMIPIDDIAVLYGEQVDGMED